MEFNLLDQYLASKELTSQTKQFAEKIVFAFKNSTSRPIRCFLIYLLLTKLEGVAEADSIFHKVIDL